MAPTPAKLTKVIGRVLLHALDASGQQQDDLEGRQGGLRLALACSASYTQPPATTTPNRNASCSQQGMPGCKGRQCFTQCLTLTMSASLDSRS